MLDAAPFGLEPNKARHIVDSSYARLVQRKTGQNFQSLTRAEGMEMNGWDKYAEQSYRRAHAAWITDPAPGELGICYTNTYGELVSEAKARWSHGLVVRQEAISRVSRMKDALLNQLA